MFDSLLQLAEREVRRRRHVHGSAQTWNADVWLDIHKARASMYGTVEEAWGAPVVYC